METFWNFYVSCFSFFPPFLGYPSIILWLILKIKINEFFGCFLQLAKFFLNFAWTSIGKIFHSFGTLTPVCLHQFLIWFYSQHEFRWCTKYLCNYLLQCFINSSCGIYVFCWDFYLFVCLRLKLSFLVPTG